MWTWPFRYDWKAANENFTFRNVSTICNMLPRHKWADLSNRSMIQQDTLCRRRYLQPRVRNTYDAPMPQFCGLKFSVLFVAKRFMMEDTLWCIGYSNPEFRRVWFADKLACIPVSETTQTNQPECVKIQGKELNRCSHGRDLAGGAERERKRSLLVSMAQLMPMAQSQDKCAIQSHQEAPW